MKVKILEKKGERIMFLLEGSSPAFANALRRVIISEVPVLAVEWVDIHDNNSILFDEVIATRLGLIPLKFDPSKFNSADECKCGGKGCPLCQVVFALEKTGPGTAYSGDLKSSNREVKPTSPNFPIAELMKNHNIKFEAVAHLGIGKKHARFQAANAAYQYYPEAIVKDVAKAKKAVKDCPAGILALKGSKVVITDPAKCDLCRACADASDGGLEIKGDPTRFIFRVESISGLDPSYIITKAAEILGSKAEAFRKELAKL
jgi:DNA-directed RNA polymerase subunit D